MNIICTIADKKYLKYASRLHSSVRACGWREEFVIMTTDDDVYANCTVRKVRRDYESENLKDDRWLQFEFPKYFNKDDRILYLDADMMCLKGCDLDFMFDHELLVSTVPSVPYDVTGEIPILSKLLSMTVEFKYIMSPCVVTVGSRESDELFRRCRDAREMAESHGRGTLFAFNYACLLWNEFHPSLFPKSKVVYTTDITMKNKFNQPWFVHYGGKVGKRYWESEYNGADLGYME